MLKNIKYIKNLNSVFFKLNLILLLPDIKLVNFSK